MSDRIDLAAARKSLAGFPPDAPVQLKAGSVLALIDAVESAQMLVSYPSSIVDGVIAHERLREALKPFGGDATA